MNYIDFAKEHELLFRIDYMETSSGWDDIIHGQSLSPVARYHYDGYEFLSAKVYESSIRNLGVEKRFDIAYRTAINITHINRGKGFSVLSEYMDKLCSDVFDTDLFNISRDKIDDGIERTLNGQSEIRPQHAKYEWLTHLDIRQKRSIIGSYNGVTKNMKNLKMVEDAVSVIIGEEFDGFITAKEIAKEVCFIYGKDSISERTVRKTLNEGLKESISDHNKIKFNTDSFKMYEKMCNIHNIIGAIDAISLMRERLTKVKVAKFSSVHRNTVNNLWQEKDIQEALNNYNKVIS